MKRLTVHVTNQPRVDTQAPAVSNKKAPSRSSAEAALDQGRKDREKAASSKDKSVGKKGRFKVFNTITINDLKSSIDVVNALAEVRSRYTIALCPDSRRSNWKSGEEMYHVANQK